MARFLSVLFVVFFFAFAAADHLEFAAELSPGQEVPPPVFNTTIGNETIPIPNYAGVAVFWYDTDEKVLNWTIEHNIPDPASAHIHGPASRGQNADPFITLTTASPIRGNATLTKEQEKYLENGTLYVNIHTEEFPAGVIRGQIESAPLTFEAILTGENVVPPSESNNTGTAILKYRKETQLLTWSIVHDIADPNSGSIHGPAEDDETGPVIVTFTNVLSPVNGSATLTNDQEEALLDEKFYIEFVSAEGDIRGQVKQTGEGKKKGGLSAGVIVLIIFLVLAAVLAIGAVIFIQINKRRKQRFEVVGSQSGDYIPPNF